MKTYLRNALVTGALLVSACTPTQPQPQVLLPGFLDAKAPMSAHVVNDCGPLILDVQRPDLKIGCVYFLDPGADQSAGGLKLVSMENMGAWMKIMDEAGWKFAHLAVIERYFERPRPGTDCSDVLVMISLQDGELKKLVESDKANGAYEDRPWRGYGIPAKTSEACGESRKLSPPPPP